MGFFLIVKYSKNHSCYDPSPPVPAHKIAGIEGFKDMDPGGPWYVKVNCAFWVHVNGLHYAI